MMDCNNKHETHSLTCITYNVRGLRDDRKRGGIFSWLKAQKSDIIFLQETHCEEKDIKKWSQEWGQKDESYWCPGTNRSRGTAILLSKNIEKSEISLIFEENGRCQILDMQTKNFPKKLRFVNVYAPNHGEERKHFYLKLKDKLVSLDDAMLITGGDHNCALNSNLDRKNCLLNEGDIGKEEIQNMCNELTSRMCGAAAIQTPLNTVADQGKENLALTIGLSRLH